MEVGLSPLSIRVVTDGRAGIENQALGLAQAIARMIPANIDIRRVRWRAAFDWLTAELKASWMLDPASDDPLSQPWPDLWIGAGRASLPLSMRARARSGGRTFVVQTQDPGVDPSAFDLIVAPAHDQLSGPNVVAITGSPHRVTPGALAEAASTFQGFEALPHPRVAALIGGRSKAFDLSDARAAAIAGEISRAVEAAGGSLMLTFSRRTPDAAKSLMTEALSRLPGVIWDGEGPNPLFAMLHYADHILVTEDSANMAAEAASTGRPVHVLSMERRGAAEKFRRLHADLRERGITRPFDGTLDLWTYEPLTETRRAAHEVLRRMGRT